VAGPRIESEKSYRKTQSINPIIKVIIPTINEEQTIRDIIKDIQAFVLPANISNISILVIDGGSTDKTIDICKEENVTVVVQKGLGKGNAMREAADQTDADILVFIDGDGTYSVSDLGSLLEPLLNNQADMAVGSRTLGQREKGSISLINRIGNKTFNKAINFAMKPSHITDSLSGYRAVSKKTFSELVLFSEKFEIEVEMTVEALAKGFRIIEVPISYKIRKKGSDTKLDPLGDGLKIARTLLFILMNVNPLKFFGIISLVFFAIGVYPAVYVLHEKITTGEIVSMPSVVFSSLLFVTGTISIVVGLLSELVVNSRRRIEHLINKNLRD
jgi:dolichol-phosphate mannosyltransferase